MAEEETKQAGPIRMAAIDKMVANIRYKGQIIARTNKLESGIMDAGIITFMVGFVLSLIFVLVPVLLMGMI
jgi:tetrahydromethanopterin S-methyltransferase subunit F